MTDGSRFSSQVVVVFISVGFIIFVTVLHIVGKASFPCMHINLHFWPGGYATTFMLPDCTPFSSLCQGCSRRHLCPSEKCFCFAAARSLKGRWKGRDTALEGCAVAEGHGIVCCSPHKLDAVWRPVSFQNTDPALSATSQSSGSHAFVDPKAQLLCGRAR